jgi:uncharacterized protein YfcZ (UPF0381/DUF406 family)
MAEHQLLDDKTIRDITDDAKRWEGHCADMGSQGLAADLALHIYALLADRDTLQQQLAAATERAERAEADRHYMTNALIERVNQLGDDNAALLADMRKVGAALAKTQQLMAIVKTMLDKQHTTRDLSEARVIAQEQDAALAICKARGWLPEEE